jgi:hypothetical protein
VGPRRFLQPAERVNQGVARAGRARHHSVDPGACPRLMPYPGFAPRRAQTRRGLASFWALSPGFPPRRTQTSATRDLCLIRVSHRDARLHSKGSLLSWPSLQASRLAMRRQAMREPYLSSGSRPMRRKARQAPRACRRPPRLAAPLPERASRARFGRGGPPAGAQRRGRTGGGHHLSPSLPSPLLSSASLVTHLRGAVLSPPVAATTRARCRAG